MKICRLISILFTLTSFGFSATVLRISCGGSGGTDSRGNVWLADTYFIGGAKWDTSSQPELGNQDSPYKSLRYSAGTSFSYNIPVSAGNYTLTLKFLEPNKTAIGQRIFSVNVNGVTGLQNLDIFAAAPGALKPYDRSWAVSAPNGAITLNFIPNIGNAVISGIQLDTLDPPPPAAAAFLDLIPTHPANLGRPTAPNSRIFSNADNVGKLSRMDSDGNVFLIEGTTPPAPPAVTVLKGQNIPSPSGGDTQGCTLVSSAIRPGNWNGGSIICQYNDGHDSLAIGMCGGNGGGNSIALYSLDSYDPNNVANTHFSCINPMTSYGAYAAPSCYDGVHQMKSRKPFAISGLLFLPIFCMNGPTPAVGSPWEAFQSGIVVSPDGGQHFCNYQTYTSFGNTCTAANWKTDGDNPTSAAGFQWPIADGTNKVTRMQLVDFLCQDNTINCPVSETLSGDFLYFLPSDSLGANAYLMRAPKASASLMMLPQTWEFFNSGFWLPTTNNLTNIGIANPCCSSVAYLADFKVFATWTHPSGFATATALWAPWQTRTSDTPEFSGFPSPIPGLCPKYDTNWRVTCTVFESPATDLHIYEEDLGQAAAAQVAAIQPCTDATQTFDCTGLFRIAFTNGVAVVGVSGNWPAGPPWQAGATGK